MRTWLLSPSCAVSVEAVESINAELRGGGPLVGRTYRRVSQSGLRKNRIQGFNRGPLRQRLESGATCGPSAVANAFRPAMADKLR